MNPFTPKELRERITAQCDGIIAKMNEAPEIDEAFLRIADKVDHDSTTPPFPSIQEQENFWKEKEGRCCGCNLSIPLDQQYCDDCESFLLDFGHDESREL